MPGPKAIPPSPPTSASQAMQAWWLWAGSFGRSDSPVQDSTGARCAARRARSGLAGTTGTLRSCTVPSGKYLFFPLINYVVMQRPGSLARCADLMGEAADTTDDVSALLLDLDGIRLPPSPPTSASKGALRQAEWSQATYTIDVE